MISGSVVVGIDMGGTGIRLVTIDGSGTVLKRASMPTPTTDPGPALDWLISQVGRILDDKPVSAIGIGASGPIDADGIIRNPDTLPAFTGIPIREGLGKAFSIPVLVENDAVTAAVAEHRVGAAQGSASLLHVTLGTGIGVALLVDGAPVRAADGTHPESGHISIPGVDGACYCGRTSCWEQRASRRALQGEAAGLLGLPPDDGAAIATAASLAREGDEPARSLFDLYGRKVALGLADLLAIHRPELVVLGGGGADFFSLFEAGLRQQLALHRDWISSPLIVASTLDDFGGAIGGGLLALSGLPA